MKRGGLWPLVTSNPTIPSLTCRLSNTVGHFTSIQFNYPLLASSYVPGNVQDFL